VIYAKGKKDLVDVEGKRVEVKVVADRRYQCHE
jgi:hypothetical protein